jgi:hypothetical protein
MTPHVHSTEIHAFAEGYEIEVALEDGTWRFDKYPSWNANYKYRIKDPVKAKIKMWQWVYKRGNHFFLTKEFFANEPRLVDPVTAALTQMVQRAEWTMLEVEEE